MLKPSRIATSFGVACVAVVTLVAATHAKDKPLCEVAREWVADNMDALPTTLAELSTFTPTYRRAIYDALPLPTRANLWRAHLSSFTGPTSTLTTAQRDVVAQVMANLDTYLADKNSDDTLRPVILSAFSIQEGAPVFAMLGPMPLSPNAGGSPFAECECEVGDNWCAFNHCNRPREGCTPVDACGTLWLDQCDGVCREVGNDED